MNDTELADAESEGLGTSEGSETPAVAPEEQDPDQLRAELHEARARIDAAEAKADEYLDDLQRLKAEFENYRKRMLREQTEAVSRAGARLIEELLNVVDDFDLALAALSALEGNHSAVAKGVEVVYAKLVDLLGKEGVERVDQTGVPFDTEVHEAVAHDDDDGVGSDLIVAEVFRPGYRMGSKILRPAMVKVSQGAGE